MLDEITKDAKTRMIKSVEALKNEFSRIRTGRAHPSILEHVKVSYYDNNTPLNQTANIAIENSRTLTVTPWDKSMVPAIEKAIISADLGLNPVTAGTVIRVPMPPLSEERRKGLVKVVRDEAEQTRVAVRNIRRDANQDIKELLKEKMINEDEQHRGEAGVQKLTDQFIADVDAVLDRKEKDLLEI